MTTTARMAALVLTLLVVSVTGASADTLLYTFTGGPVTATFELDSNPTLMGSIDGFGFSVVPTGLMINGAPSSDFLFFYNGDPLIGGAFGAFPCTACTPDLSLTGPQLYSGPESSPTMLIVSGVDLLDVNTGAFAGTLNVTNVTTPTPEPSSLALAVLGSLAVLACSFLAKRSNPLKSSAK